MRGVELQCEVCGQIFEQGFIHSCRMSPENRITSLKKRVAELERNSIFGRIRAYIRHKKEQRKGRVER